MTLDEIMKVIAEIEDEVEFNRLWKRLGEMVYEVAKRREAKRRAALDRSAE